MSHVIIAIKDGQQQIFKIDLNPDQAISVGRGWQNNVIINDEFIDAQHLSFMINTQGQISVTDLDTKNGTRQIKSVVSGTQSYELGNTLTIGESIVSLHTADTTVAPALKQDGVQKASRMFSSFLWVAIATLLVAVSVVGIDYWSSGTETTSELLVELGFMYGAVLFGWCLVAGFIGKIFRHKTHFKLHWIFICSTIILGALLTVTTDVLRFNIDTEPANHVLPEGASLVVLGITVFGFLSLSTRMGFFKKVITASTLASLTLIYTLSTGMLAQDHETWQSYARVERINQPPAFMLKTPVSIAAHIQNTEKLFAELDTELKAIEDSDLNLDKLPLQSQTPVQITENLDD